jgi:hypothetical protein
MQPFLDRVTTGDGGTWRALPDSLTRANPALRARACQEWRRESTAPRSSTSFHERAPEAQTEWGGRHAILDDELVHLAASVVRGNQRGLRSLAWSAWVAELNSRVFLGSTGAEPQAS